MIHDSQIQSKKYIQGKNLIKNSIQVKTEWKKKTKINQSDTKMMKKSISEQSKQVADLY